MKKIFFILLAMISMAVNAQSTNTQVVSVDSIKNNSFLTEFFKANPQDTLTAEQQFIAAKAETLKDNSGKDVTANPGDTVLVFVRAYLNGNTIKRETSSKVHPISIEPAYSRADSVSIITRFNEKMNTTVDNTYQQYYAKDEAGRIYPMRGLSIQGIYLGVGVGMKLSSQDFNYGPVVSAEYRGKRFLAGVSGELFFGEKYSEMSEQAGQRYISYGANLEAGYRFAHNKTYTTNWWLIGGVGFNSMKTGLIEVPEGTVNSSKFVCVPRFGVRFDGSKFIKRSHLTADLMGTVDQSVTVNTNYKWNPCVEMKITYYVNWGKSFSNMR